MDSRKSAWWANQCGRLPSERRKKQWASSLAVGLRLASPYESGSSMSCLQAGESAGQPASSQAGGEPAAVPSVPGAAADLGLRMLE
jgi:hypothetical protein